MIAAVGQLQSDHVIGEPVFELVTLTVGEQLFGVPVLEIQDVLSSQEIAKIPLAPEWVAGALNLRGKIVTAINLGRRLGLPDSAPAKRQMSIVVENQTELYSLLVDDVGEVLQVNKGDIDSDPLTLERAWQSASCGIVRLEDRLLTILDVQKLFEPTDHEAA